MEVNRNSTGRYGSLRLAMAHTRSQRPPALQTVDSEAEEGDLSEWDPDAIQVRHTKRHRELLTVALAPPPCKPRYVPRCNTPALACCSATASRVTERAYTARSRLARTRKTRTTRQPSSALQAKMYRRVSPIRMLLHCGRWLGDMRFGGKPSTVCSFGPCQRVSNRCRDLSRAHTSQRQLQCIPWRSHASPQAKPRL